MLVGVTRVIRDQAELAQDALETRSDTSDTINLLFRELFEMRESLLVNITNLFLLLRIVERSLIQQFNGAIHPLNEVLRILDGPHRLSSHGCVDRVGVGVDVAVH